MGSAFLGVADRGQLMLHQVRELSDFDIDLGEQLEREVEQLSHRPKHKHI